MPAESDWEESEVIISSSSEDEDSFDEWAPNSPSPLDRSLSPPPGDMVLTEEDARAVLRHFLFGAELEFCERYLFPKRRWIRPPERGRWRGKHPPPEITFSTALLCFVCGDIVFSTSFIHDAFDFLSPYFPSFNFPCAKEVLKFYHLPVWCGGQTQAPKPETARIPPKNSNA